MNACKFLLVPPKTSSYDANEISSMALNLVSLKNWISLKMSHSFFRMYPKADADVQPPISVAAVPVMAVSKIVLLVKLCPIFWLNCFAYAINFSSIFAFSDRVRL